MKLLFSLVFLTLSALLAAAPQNLVIGCDHFPPYVIHVKNDAKMPGFAIELCRKLLPPGEFNLIFRSCSWKSGLERITRRELDGFLMVAPADFPDLVYPKEPLGIVRPSLWSAEKCVFPEKEKHFLVMRKDVFFSDEAEALAKAYEAEKKLLSDDQIKGPEKALAQLLRKKAFLIIEECSFMQYRKKTAGKKAQKWTCIRMLGDGTCFYAAFSNRVGQGWRARWIWDRNFRKFSQTKEYQDLLKKYGLSEQNPAVSDKKGK